jgi:hypothetical protein
MSQENVEIVRRAYEAFSRAGLDALLDHFHGRSPAGPGANQKR